MIVAVFCEACSEGFINSVNKKLSNERFLNNAPEAVLNKEKQKQADAMAKIQMIEEKLKIFNK